MPMWAMFSQFNAPDRLKHQAAESDSTNSIKHHLHFKLTQKSSKNLPLAATAFIGTRAQQMMQNRRQTVAEPTSNYCFKKEKNWAIKAFSGISQLWHVDTSFPHISWALALQLSSLFWLPLCCVEAQWSNELSCAQCHHCRSALQRQDGCRRCSPTYHCRHRQVKGRHLRSSDHFLLRDGETKNKVCIWPWCLMVYFICADKSNLFIYSAEPVLGFLRRSGPPLSVFDKLSWTLCISECQFVKYPKWGVTSQQTEATAQTERPQRSVGKRWRTASLISCLMTPMYF